ncbi:glycine/D-amino acid oxidase-like deaminating enzyme [Taibaiella chishuiensis]|uniref:Glycine/D-amino acid oxidase-like deaminating enzyme n=1 Tax=Taibaiella chishuiensis TaxID=1434707 RepID=A0A2P8DB16_9BACT|nr:glycine/D-amino acid oxidase-like deaminating enzyme [Taibaiella chishuiensis]
MHVDFLIVGQGITGTLLSYELLKAGKRVLVVDRPDARKASLVAGAVINPLSGKGFRAAQHAALLIPAALQTYRSLETLLDKALLREQTLYIFPGDEEEVRAFDAAIQREAGSHLHWMPEAARDEWGNYFHMEQGIGMQQPVWQVDAASLLECWRQYLVAQDAYREEVFAYDQLVVNETQTQYKDITAGTVVFCEGTGAVHNPFLQGLPFTRNRGDVLLLSAPGLPATGIYHRGLRLVPRADGLFWCGSNYRWQFDDLEPDTGWQAYAETLLGQWLRVPFAIEAHLVAERPTTAGQVPLIGRHPRHAALAVFNGLGTRGFSSGPYWAAQLCRLLCQKEYSLSNYSKDWLDRHWSKQA